MPVGGCTDNRHTRKQAVILPVSNGRTGNELASDVAASGTERPASCVSTVTAQSITVYAFPKLCVGVCVQAAILESGGEASRERMVGGL